LFQVVFKRSEDAESAFKYCRANVMFGSPKIRYELREVVFQETGKKGRVNGEESPRGLNNLTYDELLKGPAKVRTPFLGALGLVRMGASRCHEACRILDISESFCHSLEKLKI
jgi:hypothetical protein